MKLLFKVILSIMALIPLYSHADEIDVNFSGYVAGTYFSDHSWYPSAYTAAVNADVFYDRLVFRTQIGEPYQHPVRRLTVEWGGWIMGANDFNIVIGKFPRLNSFFSSVTDSPGSTGLAILPPAIYNRRMLQNATFNSIDGISILDNYVFKFGLLKTNFNYGKTVVDNQCGFQNEVTRAECRQGFDYKGLWNSYDIGLTFEKGDYSIFYYKGRSLATTILKDPNDPLSVFERAFSDKIVYDVEKIGLKYNVSKYWIQGEYTRTKFNDIGISGQTSFFQKSFGYYLLAGYYWQDNLSTHISYSRGRDADNGKSRDISVGTTYVYKNTTLSVEYHRGEGILWKKYFSPNAKWNSAVISITQRF